MPQPGAPTPTGYIYLDVPFSSVRQQSPDFTWFASTEPYYTIEHFAKRSCIFGVYRLDLVDRSRVYRFPNTSRNSFTPDKCHQGEFYLEVYPIRYQVLDADPSVGKAVAREWTPI